MNKKRGRPFELGNQVGLGRPKGSRNREPPPGQNLFAEYGEHLTRKCISQAMQGVPSAMRLCMERISPVRLGACVSITLPKIKTAGDVERAAEKLMREVGRGTISPDEAASVMSLLETRMLMIEKGQWESRLEKLEEAGRG